MVPSRRSLPMSDLALRPRRRTIVATGVVILLVAGLGVGLAAHARAAVPVRPASAEVVLSRSEGPPGTTTLVRGRGYAAFETVDLYEDTNLTTTVGADGSGAFA